MSRHNPTPFFSGCFKIMSWNKILFFHLPKTGGLSIKDAFVKVYNHVFLESYTFLAPKSFYMFYQNTLKTKDQDPYKFIYIHEWTTQNPFSFIHPRKDDFCFTIIRHPINLFYSLYYYIKQGGSEESPTPILHGLPHQMIKSSQSIKQYIDWVLDYGYIIKDCILPIGYYNNDILSKMTYVGIYEDMQTTISVLDTSLGIKLDLPHLNVGKYDKDYTYRRAELEEFFNNEIQLYDYYAQKPRTTFVV